MSAPTPGESPQLPASLRSYMYDKLNSNQSILWKHFVIAIISHLDLAARESKLDAKSPHQHIDRHLEEILRWMSDPTQRLRFKQMERNEKKWRGEEKQWKRTFEDLLDKNLTIKAEVEASYKKCEETVKSYEQMLEDMFAQNTVLKQSLQVLKGREHGRPEKAVNTPSIPNQQQIQQKSAVRLSICLQQALHVRDTTVRQDEINPKGTLSESTMTDYILPRLSEQISFIVPNHSRGCQTLALPQLQQKNLQLWQVLGLQVTATVKPKLSRVSQTEEVYEGQSKTNIECQTLEESEFLPRFENASNILSKKENTVENLDLIFGEAAEQMQVNNMSCISSSSSYIVEQDTAVQTQAAECRHFGMQTQASDSRSTGLQTQAVECRHLAMQTQQEYPAEIVPGLLLRLSQLEMNIEQKSCRIAQLLQNERASSTKLQELSQELLICSHICEHTQGQLTQLRKQHARLEESYRDIVNSFSHYMSAHRDPPLHPKQQPPKNTNLAISKVYSEFIDCHSAPVQHQDTEPACGVPHTGGDYIEKATMSRYIQGFLKLQLEGCNGDKKLNAIETVLEILGSTGSCWPLLQQYKAKLSITHKVEPPSPGISQKLYLYLTEDS